MNIDITLSDEQVKALKTQYASTEDYVQRIVTNRANQIMNDIARRCALGEVSVDLLSSEEQVMVDKILHTRIVAQADHVPTEIKNLLVRKARIPSMAEKIIAQELKAA